MRIPWSHGEISLGVFGFMDTASDGVPLFRDTNPVTVLDPVETAKKEVEALKKRCDFIIALAYMDQVDVIELVKKVSGISVVVVSHTHAIRQDSDHTNFMPEQVDDTILIRCPDGGRVLGRLDLMVVNGSYSFSMDSQAFNLRPESVRMAEEMPEFSTARNTFIDLDSSLPTDTEIFDFMDPMLQRITAVYDSLGIAEE